MRVLITGACGFIGSVLTRLILERGAVGGQAVSALALVDKEFAQDGVAPRPGEAAAGAQSGALVIEGDLTLPALQERITKWRPDLVFHLASMPGGAAEADYAAGRQANLQATLALFEILAAQPGRPVVVYASSIAVYGTGLPLTVTPDTPLHPPISYGAHKLACEIVLSDLTRRGAVDGRSLRLPGIVARPAARHGLASAFMSDVLHALHQGQAYTCPVGPQATAWWMSARRCADNLLHAATMPLDGADRRRAWPLPVLRLSLQQVVQAGSALFGPRNADLISYAPQSAIEAIFGRYPRLDDRDSRALGLRDDGDARALILRALNLLPGDESMTPA